MILFPSTTAISPAANAVLRMRERNDALHAAMDAHDAWRAPHDAIAALIAEAKTWPEAPTDADIREQARVALLAGEPVGDLPARLVETAAVWAGHHQARTMAESLIGSLETQRQAALTSQCDRLLSHLNGQLAEVIEQAREAYPSLAGISTAEQAITAGVTTEWSIVSDLEQRYLQIREAQLALIRHHDPDLWTQLRDQPVGAAVHLANTLEVCPLWANAVRFGIMREAGETTRLQVPWPQPLSSVQALRWFTTTPEAKAWVPTIEELDIAVNALAAALRAATQDGANDETPRDLFSQRTERDRGNLVI